MTELADEARVIHRTGKARVDRTQPWRRKVGGRTGATVTFPAGTYSDDTQLRLAASRAIRADGSFDVAAFAKVELTAWASYALGAGIGSREAASNLARTSATWYSNHFKTRRADYLSGGGNGAAMRVQPHVWAASKPLDFAPLLRDVVRNAICTHGHPRGIIGACVHALALAVALNYGRPPSLTDLADLAHELRALHEIVESDTDLRLFWLGPWVEGLGTSPADAFETVVKELQADLKKLSYLDRHGSHQAIYHEAVISLEADHPASRGSGTKTALLAAYLGDLCHGTGPEEAMIIAANEYGSDTDSIATMAGAILGACSDSNCDHEIQDRAYIARSASRLAAVAEGRAETTFGYPDLRSWKPARAAVDAIALTDEGLILNGLGRLTALDKERVLDGEFELRWFELEFGQTILARVRRSPRTVEKASKHVVPERRVVSQPQVTARAETKLPDLFSNGTSPNPNLASVKRPENGTLNQGLQRAIESGFDPRVIGELLLAQATPPREDFLERSIALAATIITAFEARQRRRKP